jgi:DNA-binding GntR family transcriptional regulator
MAYRIIERRTPDRASLTNAQQLVERLVAEHFDKPSLVSRIACEVGAEIVELARLPDEDLNSVDLSKRYKTSRTPIREALMLLAQQGLVSIPPRRRPRVTPIDLAEIREIYRVRAVLLEFIAADVARSITSEQLDALGSWADRMEDAFRALDVDAYLWANVAFHEKNTLIAANRTVGRIIDSLLLRTLRLRRLSLSDPARLAQSLDDHRRLVRAYADRDATLAAALIRSNHMAALARLERLLAPEPPSA